MLEPVSEDPLVRAGSPGTQLRAMKTTLDASLQDPDTRSINPKTSKPLRKVMADPSHALNRLLLWSRSGSLRVAISKPDRRTTVHSTVEPALTC